MIDCCNTCEYKDIFNGKSVCSYETIKHNGIPERLPDNFWCECYKEKKDAKDKEVEQK